MDAQDRKAFASQMTMLAEMYGKQASAALGDIWWRAMQGVSLAQFQQAIAEHVSDPDAGKWMPKLADVLAKIQGSGEAQALAAWQKVDHTVRRLGPWNRYAFDDCRIHAAIDAMGGLTRLMDARDGDWPHLAREFQKHYARWITKKPESYPAALSAESASAPVQYIGNPQRAKLVHEQGGSGSVQVTNERKMAQLVGDAAKALEAK